MDQDVGTGLEGPADLTFTLGMYAYRQSMQVGGTNHRMQRRVVEQGGTAVQHQFDQVVSMRDGLFHRADAFRWSCQFMHRSRWSPGPIDRVPAYGGQERSSDPDQPARGWIDLPGTGDAWHPAQVVHLDHCGVCQCGGIYQTKVDMRVDDAGQERARKLRHMSPLHSSAPERDRPQLIVNLLQKSRSESLADP
jgi:hypothetical protein